jgi:DNA-directed RNA polymerase subunit alpha
MLALEAHETAQIFYLIDTNSQRTCYIVGQHKANQEWPPGSRTHAKLPDMLIPFLIEGGSPMTRIPLPRIDTQAEDLSARLEMSTAEIGLSVRTTNCLEERGIFTVNDLLHCTREDLLSISNFGEKTLEEVYKALEGVGFYRRGKRDLAKV